MWPELDTLLREEGDTAVTPYTAAVLEYRVSIHSSEDALSEKHFANGNGHVVFDAQHPYRCPRFFFLSLIIFVLPLDLIGALFSVCLKSKCSCEKGASHTRV